ncbi:imidazole glycerol phosphate synthase subunit HisH [Alphaproteobacteria bacterium]|nr:imidazole glycerol phosphate synthase subunit HisH [Alphaproteobacteria bacterium]
MNGNLDIPAPKMKLDKRVIATLDIKNEKLVKGIGLEGLRQIGDPAFFAKLYYEEGIDEIYFRDVVASLYNQNTIKEIIKNTAENCFIPIMVGGGIRSLYDIEAILKAGGDKVAINTAAVLDKQFIQQAVKYFGSSSISVQVDTQRIGESNKVTTESGRNITDIDTLHWIKTAQSLGAGEIILTSVERDGSGDGFDFKFINELQEIISTPLIISGGAGNLGHLSKIGEYDYVSGVGIASMLHNFYSKRTNQKTSRIRKYEIGNTDFVQATSVLNIKKELKFERLPERIIVKPSTLRKNVFETQIGVLDYGAGNIYSVQNALKKLGVSSYKITKPSDLKRIDALIIPGVGEFESAMKKLQQRELVNPIIDFSNNNKSVLGICLGMHLLFESSQESPGCQGLGLLKGQVKLLPNNSGNIPNIGWRQIELENTNKENQQSSMYFIHSYYVSPDELEIESGHTPLKSFIFPSIVESKNIKGWQFHPELSGWDGLLFLKNWVEGVQIANG